MNKNMLFLGFFVLTVFVKLFPSDKLVSQGKNYTKEMDFRDELSFSERFIKHIPLEALKDSPVLSTVNQWKCACYDAYSLNASLYSSDEQKAKQVWFDSQELRNKRDYIEFLLRQVKKTLYTQRNFIDVECYSLKDKEICFLFKNIYKQKKLQNGLLDILQFQKKLNFETSCLERVDKIQADLCRLNVLNFSQENQVFWQGKASSIYDAMKRGALGSLNEADSLIYDLSTCVDTVERRLILDKDSVFKEFKRLIGQAPNNLSDPTRTKVEDAFKKLTNNTIHLQRFIDEVNCAKNELLRKMSLSNYSISSSSSSN